MPESAADKIDAFIARWAAYGGHERAHYGMFLIELFALLDLPQPDPPKPENRHNAYTFERAFNQAERYIHDLPATEGRPPYLIVCDVGHVFEIYAEFSRTGGRYQRLPDPKNHRIYLEDLRDPENRALLRAIWKNRTLEMENYLTVVVVRIAHRREDYEYPMENKACLPTGCPPRVESLMTILPTSPLNRSALSGSLWQRSNVMNRGTGEWGRYRARRQRLPSGLPSGEMLAARRPAPRFRRPFRTLYGSAIRTPD